MRTYRPYAAVFSRVTIFAAGFSRVTMWRMLWDSHALRIVVFAARMLWDSHALRIIVVAAGFSRIAILRIFCCISPRREVPGTRVYHSRGW